MLVRFAALSLAVAASFAPAQAADAPRRIVSFNLCADQLVIALADPEQITGLSPYAIDPAVSVVSEQAKKYPAVPWQAESIIPLKPDLVILSRADRAITRQMLTSLGVRVETIDLVADLTTAEEQVRTVAKLVGHPERGEALVREIEAARKRLAEAPRPRGGSTALLVGNGGWTAGPASLAAALLHEAGLRPPTGAPVGFGGFIPLEQLAVLRPDYIFVSNSTDQPVDQSSVYLTHPAMKILYPRWKRVILPGRYTLCGGPALPEALDYLTGVLTRLAARQPANPKQ